MRNALEHGDPGTDARCGSLVAQGAAMLANLSQDVPMNARSNLMSALINEGDTKRRASKGQVFSDKEMPDWESVQSRPTQCQDPTRGCF